MNERIQEREREARKERSQAGTGCGGKMRGTRKNRVRQELGMEENDAIREENDAKREGK